jgi:DNA-binding transcriptional MerR regulator
MPVKKIKEYIDLCMRGDETLEERRQIFIKQRENVLRQMAELTENLRTVEYKIKHYDEAVACMSSGWRSLKITHNRKDGRFIIDAI